MLTLYRRHRAGCRYEARRAKCSCPIWVQGKLRGERLRQSLDLTNWEAAQKLIREWEAHGAKNVLSLGEAYKRFLAQHEANGSAAATVAKHKLLKREMLDFFGDIPVRSISLDDVARFRESWDMAPISAKNKIERIRAFFKFCLEREWVERNAAKLLKPPKISEITPKPYEPRELEKIREAIEQFPNRGVHGELNRERVRAFVSVLRWTGMRIGDAVQLHAGKIVAKQVILRTQKNGKRVSIPLHPETAALIKALKNGSHYFFWSGEGTVKSATSCWQKSMARLGALAKVHVHAHRFRHTLAAELLSKGTPVSQVADILGNSPRIVEKHYSQWIASRQDALNEAVKATWG